MFFTFNQNNSGGSFAFEEGKLTNLVIIEAESVDDVIDKAEDLGIYFGGYGDCDCCGDRWCEPYGDDGDKEPMIYGRPVADYFSNPGPYSTAWMEPDPECYVHYLDGRVEEFRFPEEEK
jgi:hypothetical protein